MELLKNNKINGGFAFNKSRVTSNSLNPSGISTSHNLQINGDKFIQKDQKLRFLDHDSYTLDNNSFRKLF